MIEITASKQVPSPIQFFFLPPWRNKVVPVVWQMNVHAYSYLYFSQVDEGVFEGVEWNKWFYDPGLPPHKPVLV